MVLFIALPMAGVLYRSFFVTKTELEAVTIEVCTPGFTTQTCVTKTEMQPKLDASGRKVTETSFAGLTFYRQLVRPDVLGGLFTRFGASFATLQNLDFYRALRFTFTFTLVTLPLILGIGLVLALAVDRLGELWRGPVIFVSLLPFVITPVIGALSIKWLFEKDGLMTAFLEFLLQREPLFLFAQGWTVEVLMLFYRVWHVVPFAFVVFFAGLQTLNRDSMEAAIIDGASRFERLRYVILPHLTPLVIFVTLIHLMDAYRVFEEVVGFSSQAHRISLQWLTYQFLTPDDSGNRQLSSASASSVLTMLGVMIILVPVLRQFWRQRWTQ